MIARYEHGRSSKTIGGALFDGAGTALRLIFLLRVGMRGSLLQAGALHSQPPTPGRMAAAGDVAKGRADRQVLQGQRMTTLTMRLIKGHFIVSGPDVEPMKFKSRPEASDWCKTHHPTRAGDF